MSNVGFIYGLHPIRTMLTKNPGDVSQIYVDRERVKQTRFVELLSLAKTNKVKLDVCDKAELSSHAGDVRHQGAIAKCRFPSPKSEKDLISILENSKRAVLILVLDQVQDPHNLGACLRSADACGVDCVIAPKDRSASLTATVFKVSSGAALTVPYVQVTNMARTLRLLREYGLQLIGTSDATTHSLFEMDLIKGTVIILGAEATGMRRLTASECDHLVQLPMQGVVESLNVSVAAGVCMYEAVRQRHMSAQKNS